VIGKPYGPLHLDGTLLNDCIDGPSYDIIIHPINGAHPNMPTSNFIAIGPQIAMPVIIKSVFVTHPSGNLRSPNGIRQQGLPKQA